METTKVYLIVCCVILGILNSHGYTYIEQNAVNKDFPGECYDKNTKIHFKPGETRQRPGLCETMTCGRDNSIVYYGCGVSMMDEPNCVKLEQDFSKGHPDCCTKYKCEIEGKIYYL
ncbi:uncharacterized protein LOC129724442 [Wyeomyia smithii]|uniref:uncharacterized protein LOC129724442 n=1 Tax=Wyeomyia smithii TaxID=174621 RepID=UPI002467BFB7|nr:uncharacterized protein LOC129724442 [Wyeomyia smithii]